MSALGVHTCEGWQEAGAVPAARAPPGITAPSCVRGEDLVQDCSFEVLSDAHLSSEGPASQVPSGLGFQSQLERRLPSRGLLPDLASAPVAELLSL